MTHAVVFLSHHCTRPPSHHHYPSTSACCCMSTLVTDAPFCSSPTPLAHSTHSSHHDSDSTITHRSTPSFLPSSLSLPSFLRPAFLTLSSHLFLRPWLDFVVPRRLLRSLTHSSGLVQRPLQPAPAPAPRPLIIAQQRRSLPPPPPPPALSREQRALLDNPRLSAGPSYHAPAYTGSSQERRLRSGRIASRLPPQPAPPSTTTQPSAQRQTGKRSAPSSSSQQGQRKKR